MHLLWYGVGSTGEYDGLVGEYDGLVGEYDGLVGEYDGLVGEYVGPATFRESIMDEVYMIRL